MSARLLAATALVLLLAAAGARADVRSVDIPARSATLDIAVEVPENAKILHLNASAAGASTFDRSVVLYLKSGGPFIATRSLAAQADYWANSNGGNGAGLAIGTYAAPALHAGTWHLAVANESSRAQTVTLRSEISTTTKVPTDFVVSFDPASRALESAYGGADKLNCDTVPWHDTTPLAGTTGTVGDFRKGVIRHTLEELSTQIHSPVPVHVQACWQDFEPETDDGSYTLAAATGVYLFYNDQGMDLRDTWYAMAPAERLAGRRACQQYGDVDCTVPEIIVWFNSNEIARHNYETPSLEPRVRSIMMHEITHGLGFLSLVSSTEKDDDGKDNPDFMKLFRGRPDAYSAWVGYVKQPFGTGATEVIPFIEMDPGERRRAVTSKQYLVWDDADLAADPRNRLSANPWPRNLVQLHAPDPIRPGSTLSHFAAVHTGQLMTAFIQPNNPQVLGLAEGVLARVGWHDEPAAAAPQPGNWYDSAHSGHGIDLEFVRNTPDGAVYVGTFYTFDANGKSEYYQGPMLYRNGHMGSPDDSTRPADFGRPIYDPVSRSATYPDGAIGAVSLDFQGAEGHPACAGRSAPAFALMEWTIGSDSGTWCISPLVAPEHLPERGQDLNALWSAGPDDSGWGLTVLHTDEPDGMFFNPILFYYDTDNQPRWAMPDKIRLEPGKPIDIGDATGYCRTCTPVEVVFQRIGTMTVGLHEPEPSYAPSGKNWISVDIGGIIGGPYFQRERTPISMYMDAPD